MAIAAVASLIVKPLMTNHAVNTVVFAYNVVAQ